MSPEKPAPIEHDAPTPRFSLSRRAVIAGAVGAALAVGGVAAIGVATSHHTVQLLADGASVAASGFYTNVADVLAAQQVEVGEHDRVTPELHAKVSDNTVIEVLRAQPYDVVPSDGAFAEVQWSTEASLAEVYEDLAATESSAITVSREHVRSELPVVQDPQTVSVSVDGDSQDVPAVGDETVADVLEAAGYQPAPTDSVHLRWADGVAQIQVTTEQRGFVTSTESIPFTTEQREDPNRERGSQVVTQEGKEGQRTRVNYQQVRGGATVVSALVSDEVTAQPVTKIVTVGTNEPVVAPTPTVVDTSQGDSPQPVPQTVPGDVWAALAQCESSGNPSLVYGAYHGLYQFTVGTWQSVGGTGLPSAASPAEQTMRAQILQARSGWGQWPACSRRLGLR